MDNSTNSDRTPDNGTGENTPGSYGYGDDSTRSFGSHSQFDQAGQASQYSQASQYDSTPYGSAAGYGQDTSGSQFGQAPVYAQQPQYNQQSGAYPNPSIANQTGASQDSFFGALFDFSFTKYATPSIAKVLYILYMIGIGLAVLFFTLALLIGASDDDGGPAVLILLPLVLLGALLYLALVRVGLEVGVSMIRTSQSVQSIDKRQAEQVAQNSVNGGGSAWGGQL